MSIWDRIADTVRGTQKTAQQVVYKYINSPNSLNVGVTGRNNTFTANKWGAATAVVSVSYVQAIVEHMVDEFSGINYRIVDADGETIANRANPGDDVLLNALRDYAYSHNGASFFADWALNKFVTGEVYVELFRNRFGYARGLDMLNSLFVYKDVDYQGQVWQYRYGSGGNYVKYDPEEIVMDKFRSNRWNTIDGTPPLIGALNSGTVAGLRSAGLAMLSYFDKDGLPRAVAHPKEGVWDDRAIERIVKALRINQGASNKGNTQVFPFPFNATVFDIPDLQKWGDAIKGSRDDVYASYRIPQSVIGISQDTRYQVSEQDRPNYNRNMEAHFRTVASVINTQVLPFFEYTNGEKFEFDLSPFQIVSPQSIERATTGWTSGGISLNEYRVTLGYPEIEGGDDVYQLPMGGQLITRDQLLSGHPDNLQPLLPMRTAPDNVIEGKSSEYTVDDELIKWRRVAKKDRERAMKFNCDVIQPWLQDHIRAMLATDASVEEIFDTLKADISSEELNEIASIWKLLGLTELVDDIEKGASDVPASPETS